jgi:hypothetical protein
MTKQTGMIVGVVLAGICIIGGGLWYNNKNQSEKANYQQEKEYEIQSRNEQFGGKKTKRQKNRKNASKKRR